MVLLVVLATMALCSCAALAVFGEDRADKIFGTLGGVASVFTLILSLTDISPRWPGRPTRVLGDYRENRIEFLGKLRGHLRSTWQDKWDSQGLGGPPGLLPVAWDNVDELADRARDSSGTPTDRPRVSIRGSLSEPDQLASIFETRCRERMIIVGHSGQGKSILCLHLARTLLDRRSGGPVPVVLTLQGWNPERVSVAEWIAERLPIEVHQELGKNSGDERTVARAMVDDRLIIPILDGLQSVGKQGARAIQRVIEFGDRPLFIACQEPWLKSAITSARTRIDTAAVARIVPLALSEIVDWLNGSTTDPTRRNDWNFLLSTENAQIKRALGSPLFVTLARTAYGKSPGGPSKLLDPTISGEDELQVKQHLIAQLIPSSYREATQKRQEQILHWLSRLAHLAEDSDRRRNPKKEGPSQFDGRISWWRVHDAIPELPRRALKVLCIAVAAIALSGAATMAKYGRFSVPEIVTFATLFVIIAPLLERGFSEEPPAAMQFSRHPDARRAIACLRTYARRGILYGLIFGLPIFLAGALIGAHELTGRWVPEPVGVLLGTVTTTVASVVIGAGLGVGIALPLAVAEAFATPIGIERTVNPRTLVECDRNWSLVRGLGFGLGLGYSLPLLLLCAAHVALAMAKMLPGTAGVSTPPWDLNWSVAWTIAWAVPGAFAFLLTSTAWGRFAFAQAYLALRNQTPRDLMSFLEEACERGILYQIGAAYEFHDQLHDHLLKRATNQSTPTPSSASRAR